MRKNQKEHMHVLLLTQACSCIVNPKPPPPAVMRHAMQP
jgi:hypothetical protein